MKRLSIYTKYNEKYNTSKNTQARSICKHFYLYNENIKRKNPQFLYEKADIRFLVTPRRFELLKPP